MLSSIEKAESPYVKLYHGISSSQRGGDALTKLQNMILRGEIYPASDPADNETLKNLEELQMFILKKILQKGITSGQVNIDEFIASHQSDTDIMSNSFVQMYMNNQRFRDGIRSFELHIIDVEEMMRTHATWCDDNEEHTRDTYGREIYVEIEESAETSLQIGNVQLLVGPVSFSKVRRVVISTDLKDKQSHIQELLEQKGLGHITVEVRQ